MTPSSSIVGTSPFGLSARYSVALFLPNGPPTSSRSNGISSSPQHHSTFCTLLDVLRPRIFSIVIVPCSTHESVYRPERPTRSRPNAGNTPRNFERTVTEMRRQHGVRCARQRMGGRQRFNGENI